MVDDLDFVALGQQQAGQMRSDFAPTHVNDVHALNLLRRNSSPAPSRPGPGPGHAPPADLEPLDARGGQPHVEHYLTNWWRLKLRPAGCGLQAAPGARNQAPARAARENLAPAGPGQRRPGRSPPRRALWPPSTG